MTGQAGSTVIVYLALTPLPLIDEAAGDPVGELLGHTRAAVLRLICRERTTTQLASELGVSAATMSGHTKTLRKAGLIVTTRAGKAVCTRSRRLVAGCSKVRRRPARGQQEPSRS